MATSSNMVRARRRLWRGGPDNITSWIEGASSSACPVNAFIFHVIIRQQLEVELKDNNNTKDFLCPNILEDQAQWRDKTKGFSKLVIVNNVEVVDGWMKVLGI